MALTAHEIDCLDAVAGLVIDLLQTQGEDEYCELPQKVWAVVDRVDRALLAERIRLRLSTYYSSRQFLPKGEPVIVNVRVADWGEIRHTSQAAGYLYLLTRTKWHGSDYKPPYYFAVDVAHKRLVRVRPLSGPRQA